MDLQEVIPFYYYIFEKLFQVELTKSQANSLFHLCDTSRTGMLDCSEFVRFVSVLMQLRNMWRADVDFRKSAFTRCVQSTKDADEVWNAAMYRVDETSADHAWDSILLTLCSGNGTKDEYAQKLKELFTSVDSDGNGVLDLAELCGVLIGSGVQLNDRQFAALVSVVDLNGDLRVTYDEFLSVVDAKGVARGLWPASRAMSSLSLADLVHVQLHLELELKAAESELDSSLTKVASCEAKVGLLKSRLADLSTRSASIGGIVADSAVGNDEGIELKKFSVEMDPLKDPIVVWMDSAVAVIRDPAERNDEYTEL
jgi:Ca2+-binding EF-hand superfamily protein